MGDGIRFMISKALSACRAENRLTEGTGRRQGGHLGGWTVGQGRGAVMVRTPLPARVGPDLYVVSRGAFRAVIRLLLLEAPG